MKVTPELTVKDVLNIDEGMVDAFIWISPAFEQLRNPTLRQAMAERMTVAQAARRSALFSPAVSCRVNAWLKTMPQFSSPTPK